MKKRLLALSLAAGFTALMTACGDETTNTDILKADSFASDSLPKCDASYTGMLANDTSKNAIFACTKVGATYEWVNVVKNIQANENNSGCTTKELDDDAGVAVVCMGKTIATLINGEKGETGNPGKPGGPGEKGPSGSDATGYTDGKDLKLDSTDCRIVDAGTKAFVFYRCGDFTYAEDMDGFQANIRTWNALEALSHGDFHDRDYNYIGYLFTTYVPSGDAAKSVGKLVRWQGDNWDGFSNITDDDLERNFSIHGTATLRAQEDNLKSSFLPVEPFVGVRAVLDYTMDLRGWGGFCLTYESETPMDVVIVNDTYSISARATLKATSKTETTADILISDFTPDQEGVKLDEVVKNAYNIIIMAVNGSKKGLYTNTFSIFEFGAYGRCGGPTYAKVSDAVLKNKGKTGTVSDVKDKITYKYRTITIGKQVWMAENLRSPYVVKDGDDNDVYLSNCPDDKAELAAKGCLYTWAAAMDSAGKYLKDTEVANGCGYTNPYVACGATKPVRGICPEGWHLPRPAEIDTLYKNAGYNKDYAYTRNIAGKALSGKAEDGNWLGFNATQTGITKDGDFNTIEKEPYFYAWSSSETSGMLAMVMAVYPTTNEELAWTIYPDDNVEKYLGVSVRCIQDEK